jgi:hypothetical protein
MEAMKFLAPALALCVVTTVATAQQQEQSLEDRLLRPDTTAGNRMQDKAFAGPAAVRLKSFGTGSFGGVKAAPLKTFSTKSFLGIKNPWFGKKVFGTGESQFAGRADRDASKRYGVKTMATKDFVQSQKSPESDKILPNRAAPRPYLVQGAAQGAVNKFTENLQRELTIDEVRELLNKSH